MATILDLAKEVYYRVFKKSGAGPAILKLILSGDKKDYLQFSIDLSNHDQAWREVKIRATASSQTRILQERMV